MTAGIAMTVVSLGAVAEVALAAVVRSVYRCRVRRDG